MRRKHWVILSLAAAAIAASALLSASAGASTKTTKLTKVTLQLKWVTQAQFAGYYAAAAQGYYKAAGLDVNLKVGGPSITPETVVVGGGADIGLDWLPNLLATDEKGGGLVSVAQVFPRSGMTEITWKSSGINSIKKMAGKKVGVWCCGNQPELYAALTKNGIDPTNPKDVTIFNQPFDMNAFLSKQIDAAAAMTYNELAQVLETKNPATGKLYTLNDLNVFKMSDQGTGMLEDNLFTTSKWLSDPTNQATLVKFLKASFQGWIYCRDHVASCVKIVLQNGPTLGAGHQLWQMNEINKLAWPSPSGIGVVPASAVAYTVKIAKTYGVIKKTPAASTINYTYAKKALAQLKAAGVERHRHGLQGGRRQGDGGRQVGLLVAPARGFRSAPARLDFLAMSVLIKGGRVITAADDYVADVFVDGERITLIGESLDLDADRTIDARGKYVLPGCVDPHTHLDMPFGGTVTIDDVESGQTAAAFGGTTCHVDFCIQGKGQTFADALADWHAKASRESS